MVGYGWPFCCFLSTLARTTNCGLHGDIKTQEILFTPYLCHLIIGFGDISSQEWSFAWGKITES